MTSSAPPTVLIAVSPERALASALKDTPYSVVEVHSATLALAWARDLPPDVIILDAALPDMPGIDVCRSLHDDVRIGRNVPILLLSHHKPTPVERVTALRAGAWDCLRWPQDPEDLSLKLQAYLRAKRSIDVALAEGFIDPATGLHTRPALARRARELGALMARSHGALACIVFGFEGGAPDAAVASLVARAARLSDVVGRLSPTDLAVLAPGTDLAGAVRLAERIGGALIGGTGEPESTLRAGYDAVANLTYSPIDPVDLLTRAAAAMRTGRPVPGVPWVRGFPGNPPPLGNPPVLERDSGKVPRPAASGLVHD
jgi:PleD family two-component response regulator